jgi:hypothetical protein
MAKGQIKGFKNKYLIQGETTTIYIDKKDIGTLEFYIDTEDLQKLIDINLSWYAVYTPDNDSYYAQASRYLRRDNGKSIYKYYTLHTLLLNADTDNGEFVDHINYDTFNNKKSNLRKTIRSNNQRNRNSRNSNNKTGVRNVCFVKNWYWVQLQVEGKNKRLGKFKTLEEAAKFAEEMRIKYYGEYRGEAE